MNYSAAGMRLSHVYARPTSVLLLRMSTWPTNTFRRCRRANAVDLCIWFGEGSPNPSNLQRRMQRSTLRAGTTSCAERVLVALIGRCHARILREIHVFCKRAGTADHDMCGRWTLDTSLAKACSRPSDESATHLSLLPSGMIMIFDLRGQNYRNRA